MLILSVRVSPVLQDNFPRLTNVSSDIVPDLHLSFEGNLLTHAFCLMNIPFLYSDVTRSMDVSCSDLTCLICYK